MPTEELSYKAPLIAAIDVGTNSFHLVIASVDSRGMLNIVSREKEVVRLGSGANDMKYLTFEAIERGTRAMATFSRLAEVSKAEIRAIATSAVREALNREEFLVSVKTETGIDIEVVSGIEEARLIYIGVLHALPLFDRKTLVIDIGGGSTETAIGINGKIEFAYSEKIGAIRLTQKFFPNAKITRSQIAECRNFIHGEWIPVLKRISEHSFDTVVGTSGTIQSLATIAMAMKNQTQPDILNGITITAQEVRAVVNKIIKAGTVKKIAEIPGVDPSRADILLAGVLIFEQFVESLNVEKVLLSSYALREGILIDTVQKKKEFLEYKHLSHLRYSTIYDLCLRYNVNLKHAILVKDIAIKLFDELQDLHKLNFEAREHLEAAALLHDVGYIISHDQHHKHSYYILCNSIMPGFTNDEAEIIANIARYHRKSHPKKKHENLLHLSDEKVNVIKTCCAFLRIAEGLDRRQLQAVVAIEVEKRENTIKISVINAKDQVPDIEVWGAERRKLLLEEVLNKKVLFSYEL